MTNVKFNGIPFERTFTSLVDDFFTEIPTLLKTEIKKPEMKGYVPVNIFEKSDSYQIDVVAPGYEKSDFKINLNQNVLTISAEKPAEQSSSSDKVIRKEFYQRGFKRTFTVDDKIDSNKIEAQYVNGILIVSLGKKDDVKTSSKDIEIQ